MILVIDPLRETEKTDKNSQFSQNGIYVKEDDQDWGSSGMNNIQIESE